MEQFDGFDGSTISVDSERRPTPFGANQGSYPFPHGTMYGYNYPLRAMIFMHVCLTTQFS